MTVTRHPAPDWINVKDVGAKGDGTTDDTARIQAAIDAVSAAGGGTVFFPSGTYVAQNLQLAASVHLVGRSIETGYPVQGMTPKLVMKTGSTGWVIDSPSGLTRGMAVKGLSFLGQNSSSANDGGVRFQNSSTSQITSCTFEKFANQAILAVASSACHYTQNLATNCLLNRTRSVQEGVLDILGSDNWITGGEYNATMSNEGTISDANLRVCAVVVRAGGNNWLTNVVGEISDVGIVLAASGGENKLSGCRADLNYADGFQIKNANNLLVNCHAYRNGRAADNTYAGFQLTGGSINHLSNCIAENTSADTNRVKYGFVDADGSDVFKNYLSSSCDAINYRTAKYSFLTASGSAVTVQQGPPKTFTGLDTTPAVDGYATWRFNNGSATTVTNFDGGVGGQLINLISANGNTTIQNNATIKTLTGADVVLTADKFYQFLLYNAKWYQVV